MRRTPGAIRSAQRSSGTTARWRCVSAYSTCRTSRTARISSPAFHEFQLVAEIEKDFEIGGHAGKIRVTGFDSRGRMGLLDQAVALAASTDTAVDIAAVRRYRIRLGASLSLEQEIVDGCRVIRAHGQRRRQRRALRIHRHRPDGERGLVARGRALGPRRRHRRPCGHVRRHLRRARAVSQRRGPRHPRRRRQASAPGTGEDPRDLLFASRCCATPTSRSTTNSSPIRRITGIGAPYRYSPCACTRSIDRGSTVLQSAAAVTPCSHPVPSARSLTTTRRHP